METLWIEVALIGLGIVANGFFAGSEIALISARASRLTQMRDEHVRGAAAALRLKGHADTFLATIQIAITTVGTLASAVGGAAAIEALTPTLMRLGLPDAAAEPVALVLVIVVITYFSLVLGELAPKGIALRAPERYACLVAPVIEWLSGRSAALVRLLTASSRAVLAVLGISRTQESPFVTEDEVRYLVSEGAAKGIFEKAEEELVHNVFEFADTIVREIMVPRTVIQGLDVDTPPGDILRVASEIGHSRIPVYRGSIDRPAGTLVIKDLLAAAARGTMPPVMEMVHPTVFVPETAKITALLQEFQRLRQGLALVVDEYGTVVGLVTIEDVIEEIFGRIADERGEEEHGWLLFREADGAYVMDGMAPIEDVQERLGLPLEGSPEYQTVAGLLIHTLEAIPTAGTTVDAQGHRWTILETEGPKITKVRVHPSGAREPDPSRRRAGPPRSGSPPSP
jgi:putative hemolysin